MKSDQLHTIKVPSFGKHFLSAPRKAFFPTNDRDIIPTKKFTAKFPQNSKSTHADALKDGRRTKSESPIPWCL
jgi:hypothetical protein